MPSLNFVTLTCVGEGPCLCSLTCSLNSSVGENFTVVRHFLISFQNTLPQTFAICKRLFNHVDVSIFDKFSFTILCLCELKISTLLNIFYFLHIFYISFCIMKEHCFLFCLFVCLFVFFFWKIWIHKHLHPVKLKPWKARTLKTWTLKNMDTEKYEINMGLYLTLGSCAL